MRAEEAANPREDDVDDVPVGQLLLGAAGMLVWAVLCGVPALAIYSLAARPQATSALTWLAVVVLLLVWLPLVTLLCLWAVSTLIGWRLA